LHEHRQRNVSRMRARLRLERNVTGVGRDLQFAVKGNAIVTVVASPAIRIAEQRTFRPRSASAGR